MPNTYLTVSFKEKDAVKALGARWDAAARRWFVPDGADLTPFGEWLPTSTQTSPSHVVATARPASELQQVQRGISLSRLLQGVAKVVEDAYATGVWTTAEVLRASAKDGHVYLELSDRDSEGRVLAKANAAIWARTAERIIPEFERVTGATLGAGIKLLVRARPVYKPQFGFTLDIDAIDPTYTIGDLEARKREVRERLKRERLFELNKRLPAPWDFFSILVVAPQGAAGLGDFSKEADRLAQFAVCRFVYAHSRFQGEGAPAEIVEALRSGLARFPGDHAPDAVILIRGGGAVNDLAWLNDYELARFLCECSVPVFTGIGHERDSTLLDEVAHSSFDTPSKVIAGIEQVITRRVREVQTAFDGVVNKGLRDTGAMRAGIDKIERDVKALASATIADAQAKCEHLIAGLRFDSVHVVHQADGQVQGLLGEIRSGAGSTVAEAKHLVPTMLTTVRAEAFSVVRATKVRLSTTLPALFDRVSRDVSRARTGTAAELRSVSDRSEQAVRTAAAGAQALVREIAGQGPQKTLERGFAIVRGIDGKTLTSAKATASAQNIEVAFKDGKVGVAVRDVKLASSTDEAFNKTDNGGS